MFKTPPLVYDDPVFEIAVIWKRLQQLSTLSTLDQDFAPKNVCENSHTSEIFFAIPK